MLFGGRTYPSTLRRNYDKREVPSADASAEEHARYAVNKITEMASVRVAQQQELNRKRRGTMIWVLRALAAIVVMMLIYVLILKFWPA